MARRVLGVEAFAEALASPRRRLRARRWASRHERRSCCPSGSERRAFLFEGIIVLVGRARSAWESEERSAVAGSKAVRPHAKKRFAQTCRIGTA